MHTEYSAIFKMHPASLCGDSINSLPPNALQQPRYVGIPTFFRSQQGYPSVCTNRQIVAFVGLPFDGGCTFRPGARFGPNAVREASRLYKPYNIYWQRSVWDEKDIVDLGDINIWPFNPKASMAKCADELSNRIAHADKCLFVGGDHTIAYPVLKCMFEKHGPVTLIHFDAHFDTWDCFFDEHVTHGTPFKRASDEGYLMGNPVHLGIRGSIDSKCVQQADLALGFQTFCMHHIDDLGHKEVSRRVKERVGASPVYISVDVDVLDPAFAPGTGTPEAGGMTTKELANILRGLKGVNLVGADVVEVSPPYDSAAQQTALAAASILHELLYLC